MRLRSCLFALTTALALHARIDASPLIFTDRATSVRPHHGFNVSVTYVWA